MKENASFSYPKVELVGNATFSEILVEAHFPENKNQALISPGRASKKIIDYSSGYIASPVSGTKLSKTDSAPRNVIIKYQKPNDLISQGTIQTKTASQAAKNDYEELGSPVSSYLDRDVDPMSNSQSDLT